MNHIKELDYGTPAQTSVKSVNILLDGQKVNVPAGISVMRAASLSGFKIPKLCATDTLNAFGSCRLCLVEIEGRKGYPASCTTSVEEGMRIKTDSGNLSRVRKGVMELYISDHPLDCLSCAANGDCELQDMAGVAGLREVRYGYNGANHLNAATDESNPYFTFDASKCIVCHRCVRACGEVQGTFALTVLDKGFGSHVSAGGKNFLDSECVSCGACVQACPTASLTEKSIINRGLAEKYVETTCGYCGVGCSFRAEVKGSEIVRMMPSKSGKANQGHSCVKGRFAWGYAYHPERILEPMIREKTTDPWQKVSWNVALRHTAEKFIKVRDKYGSSAIGGITSSRCTNEETYLVQKLVRAVLGSNNVDTCARVCHSPTGYGLKSTLGTSAGTQDFDSVLSSDVIMVIGANPTAAHPVFASKLKKSVRLGAKLVVIDPLCIELVKTPGVQAVQHLALKPGTNVAVINAIAHVIITEELHNQNYINQNCDLEDFDMWMQFIKDEKNSPENVEKISGVSADSIKEVARLYAGANNAAIYYGLGVTEQSHGSTMVMGMANLAMATGNIGRKGVGINPLRGQNNVQGSCDMGSFPHEFPGYRHVSDNNAREIFENEWNIPLSNVPGLRITNMIDAAIDGTFKGIYIQGEDIAHSDPNTKHIKQGFEAMELVILQDIFLNETSKYAHVFLPGSTFIEKDGTFTNAERRINMVRKVVEPLSGMADWEITQALSNAMGYPMNYNHPSEIMDEIARTTPVFSGVSYEKINRLGSVQWPCNEKTPNGTPIMHVGELVIGKGKFMLTGFIPTKEKTTGSFPLLLTTGRILTQYNVGSQTRRTENIVWCDRDLLEIHPVDAGIRGIYDGDTVMLRSRIGEITLQVKISERMQPGVVYTTFHFSETNTNVVTTEFSDWATDCPEYKVTAVEVIKPSEPSEFQPQIRNKQTIRNKVA